MGKKNRLQKAGAGFPGVYFRESQTRKHRSQPDRQFWVCFRDSATRKQQWERCGWSGDGWTAAAAQKRRIQLLEEDRVGEYKPAKVRNAPTLTFAEFTEKHYLPHADANLKTSRDEHSMYRAWAKPHLGGKALKEICTFDVHRVLQVMEKAGRGKERQKHVFGFIRRVINRAIDWDMLDGPNPCRKIKVQNPNNARLRFLAPDEATLILEDLKAHHQMAYQMSVISLYTGMRSGEVRALKWGDIDEANGVIHLLDTKTKDRPCFITPPVQEVLNQLARGKPHDPLFNITATHPGPWFSELFTKAVKRVGLNDGVEDNRYKITAHTMRHTFASWAVQAGVPLHTVGRMLGHSTTAMTERYAHLAPDSYMKAAEAVWRAGTRRAESQSVVELGQV